MLDRLGSLCSQGDKFNKKVRRHSPKMRIMATKGLLRGKNQVIEGGTNLIMSQIRWEEWLPLDQGVSHLSEALSFTILNSNSAWEHSKISPTKTFGPFLSEPLGHKRKAVLSETKRLLHASLTQPASPDHTSIQPNL